jgi:hypothetical protein
VAEQAVERLDTDVAPAVPKLGKRRRRKCDFGEWRQALVDESLKPSQRRSLVTHRVSVRKEFAQRERVRKGESAHLPRSHLCSLNVAAMDRALKPSVCRALACHR